jgi:acid-sensing ion channel, other
MPHEVPQFESNFIAIGTEGLANVALKPKIIATSDDLRTYSPSNRKCYFSDEYQLKYFEQYAEINCEIECQIKEILKHCGCFAGNFPSKYLNRPFLLFIHIN